MPARRSVFRSPWTPLSVAARGLALAALVSSSLGCKTIPADAYGVYRLRVHGVEEMDDEALKACLATSERSRFGFSLGSSADPECGVAPFDGARVNAQLWSWPWADWPRFDRAVFQRDLRRIQRWYQARGYYDARVVDVELSPESANRSDRVTGEGGNAVCERDDDDEGCRVEIDITVEEGEPILVSELSTRVAEEGFAPPELAALRSQLEEQVQLRVGQRFDEAMYDASKVAMLHALGDAHFACAEVRGDVRVDPVEKTARVHYDVRPGPLTVIGELTVSGNADLSERVIRAVSFLDPGDSYSEKDLREAQHEIYALGAFASVEVTGVPHRNDEGVCTGQVDVDIRLTPGRRFRYGLGAGIETGRTVTVGETENVEQWDVHLVLFADHRNFLGGLRRIRVEDRPKLVFPGLVRQGVEPPSPGNELRLTIEQPSFIERRTVLFHTTRWDVGPDPNQRFFRHDLDAILGVRRTFFDGRLSFSFGVHANVQLGTANDGTESDYHVLFLESLLQLDLRDDVKQPRSGFYFQVGVQQAGSWLPEAASSWDYWRVTPEARAYVPLPLGMVLAARFSLGAMLIGDINDGALDEVSQELGPQRYRLRGGGATSHRGFPAGFLSDSGDLTPSGTRIYEQNDGGLRRWLASVELRANLTQDIGLTLFADFGDVNRGDSFRFRRLRTAVGLGLRYRTIVGPLRLDVGWLVPGAQAVGVDPAQREIKVNLGFVQFPGAVHITIGEAF